MADTPICHICKQMKERKNFILSRPHIVEHCLLCNRLFCVRHKGEETGGVCQINHWTYYRNHSELGRDGTIFRNMEHRNIEMDPSKAGLDRLAKVLMEREEIKKKTEEEQRST
ncbi:hypothetical protein H4I96_09039 [Botrytis cinerea]